MKRIVFILLIWSLRASAGNNYTVPIVSGAPTVNSMTTPFALVAGDTLNIPAGTYTSGSFKNLTGIYIRPQIVGNVSSTIHFTGPLHLFTLNQVTVGGAPSAWIQFDFMTNTGHAIDNVTSAAGAGWTDVVAQYMQFNNCTATCIGADGNMVWTYNSPLTYHWTRVTLHDMRNYMGNSGLLRVAQGSLYGNGGTGHPQDVCDSFIMYNFYSEQTTATVEPGQEVGGIFFRFNIHDIYVTTTNLGAPNGDVGIFTISGSGTARNVYKNGGNGYLFRIFLASTWNEPRTFVLTQSAKFNTSEYGLVTCQVDDATTAITGIFQGSGAQIWNNTIGNAQDQIAYWPSLVVLGETGGYLVSIKNNLAFNNPNTRGKNQMVMNQSNNEWIPQDSSNNLIFKYATNAKLDSTTVVYTDSHGNQFFGYKPTIASPFMLHDGLTNPYATIDFVGNALRTPPDLGYIQLAPTAYNNMPIVGLRKVRKIFVGNNNTNPGTLHDFSNDFNNDFY